jgi:CubicO group peptidase (beta-lactamase class C family)
LALLFGRLQGGPTGIVQPAETTQARHARHSSPSELETKVDACLAPYIANRDFSGAVLIARGDKILLSKGYGMANYELGVANGPDTKFRIASLSKTFTAAAIVILKEWGLLSLDDKLKRFIPEYPHAEKISIRQLLLHKAGVPNPDYESTFHKQLTLHEVVQALGKKPLDFEPGTSERYSNGGFLLLACVVQNVSGQSFEDFLRRNIFEPLGMNDTGNFDPETIVTRRASGYVPGPEPIGIENAPVPNLSTSIGSGSLYSTANDLLRWAQAVRSERLYKRSALPYPFGWGERNYRGRTYTEQGGITPGFRCKFLVFYEDPVTVICLANTESGLFNRWEKELLPIVFNEEGVQPVRLPKSVRIEPRWLDACVGHYRSSTGLNLHVARRGKHLFSTFNEWPVRSYLMPTAENELFMRADYASIALNRDPTGQVNELTFRWDAGGDPMKFVRSPLAESSSRQPDSGTWTVGDWTGTRRDAATNDTVSLQLHVAPILGGNGEIEQLKAEHRGDPYLGFSVRTPADKAGKWTMLYWNSKHKGFAVLNGEVHGERSIWLSTSSDQARQSRLISEKNGMDQWRRTMSVSEDQGKTWHELWIDEVRRAQKP